MLDDGDLFGYSTFEVGDFNGDSITDLAVGARDDDDGGTNRGAVWILFLNTDGTVQSHAKISDTTGGFGGGLSDGDLFGFEGAAIGDLNGDGSIDLAVGAVRDDDGGTDRGAVWILFMTDIDKVTLCHIPPGNPAKAKTLSVGPAAVAAHLAHGDTMGSCP